MTPSKIILRSYQVGFGDCFLLTIEYDNGEQKHILIDFGTTSRPTDSPNNWMEIIAKDIAEKCGGKLNAIVATHRHRDHIGGFSGKRGDIIADCEPDLIIQPWTEHPDLETDATEAFELRSKSHIKNDPKKSFAANLQSMHEVATAVKLESEVLSNNKFIEPLSVKDKERLHFMGENNVKNKGAVIKLMSMSERDGAEGLYVHTGLDIDQKVNTHIPEIKVHVLGPPTIEDYEEIEKQRSEDRDEFWLRLTKNKNFWAMQAESSQSIHSREPIFPDADNYGDDYTPSHTRWFIRRLRNIRAEQLLQLVTRLDDAMNNTSVILLFEIGGKKLLFPGDAQIENWEFALQNDEYKELLADTDLYKVGHHGSRNATPKTLWNLFRKKNEDDQDENRLISVNSTKHGKHGKKVETAVPRKTLVDALDKFSEYHTTEDIKIDKTGGEQTLCEVITIEV